MAGSMPDVPLLLSCRRSHACVLWDAVVELRANHWHTSSLVQTQERLQASPQTHADLDAPGLDDQAHISLSTFAMVHTMASQQVPRKIRVLSNYAVFPMIRHDEVRGSYLSFFSRAHA